MSTRDLIDAIEAGDSTRIQSEFQAAILDRVAARLDDMRQNVAQSMFNPVVEEQFEELDEDNEQQLDELSRGTLKSYLNKSKDRADKYQALGMAQRRQGDREGARASLKKSDNTSFGRQKARSRLQGAFYPKQMPYGMKEHLEDNEQQLDELSRSTLKSYLNKSKDRVDDYENQALAQHDDKEAGKYLNKRSNVVWARKGAMDRLTGVFHPKQGSYKMKEQFEELDEADGTPAKPATVHPNAIHIQHVGSEKYKVHAVGKNWSDGIKVGDHLSNSELDDFTDMGGKIKLHKPYKMKEQFEELDEADGTPAKPATVHPNAIHVQHVGGGKYKVHAVGKNWSDGIKAGEHLSDSELDDFSEMGGKIKNVK